MKANEFYKQKTKHDLKENCGVRLTGKELFELMEEYAQQSQPMPSDEDIRVQASKYINGNTQLDNSIWMAFIEGAKWCREKLTGSNK